jgi:hypothetical protein
MFFVKIWVKDYNNQGEPIFTLSEADAKLHHDLTHPSVPQITGNPAPDGGIGSLEVGNLQFDTQLTQAEDINTNETHTSIVLGGYLTPNPKITYNALEVGGGQRKKYFDVQVSYKWVYPSSS